MKKLDDAKRRFGVPVDAVTEADKYQIDATAVDDQKSVFIEGSHMADKIALLKMEIEALNKLLDERDELLDQMVSSPAELHGWVMCLILIMTVFLAHSLGYL